MLCNEFQYPILSVRLLQNDTDIFYKVPANAENQDVISLLTHTADVSVASSYAVLVTTDGECGTLLIADPDSFKLTSAMSTKQGGQYQKVTLEYTCSTLTNPNLEQTDNQYKTQQHTLRQNSYSLLLEFFDGSYGLIRCFSHGDGYLFGSKEDNGTITNTISITNITGIQLASISNYSTPDPDTDPQP